jgi:Flp pilus assembly protein TadG
VSTIVKRGHQGREDHRRGQALVEFALVVPILLVIVVTVAELGLIYGKLSTLGYGSREGARAGSALAQGYPEDCADNPSNNKVDAVLVSAVQRILTSPDSGIDLNKVQEIRIFRATPSGTETLGYVNIWRPGPNGPDVDPGPGTVRIAFQPETVTWNACSRNNSGMNPDSIGVTVKYTYDFVTPLPTVINAIAGGSLSLTLSETTVMALNPTT